MSNTTQGAGGVPPPQQYVLLSTQQPGVGQGPAQTVGYSKKNKQSVKGLALTQLILGITIFICQTVTTVKDDVVTNRVAKIRQEYDTFSLLSYGLADDAATGIWIGLGTVLAASIGIAGYRQQRKGLIITHLVLNVFLLIAYIALMGTVSATIDTLQRCRTYGDYFYSDYSSRYYDSYYRSSYYNPSSYYSYSYYKYRSTTTTTTTTTIATPAPILFGEKLNMKSGYFHCSHSFFRTWLAFEVILLVCCLVAFFITLVLLIYNSIAACMCCRRTGCCGSCCCYSCYGPTGPEVPSVAYTTQQPVQQFVQPQAVPQLQAAPQYYPQPAPMPVQYVQQPMAPAPVQYGQQPTVMSAPVVTYPAAAAAPPPASQPAASNEEGKQGELPPEYTTLAPQSN